MLHLRDLGTVALFLLLANAAHALPSACAADEQTLFSCPSGAKRIVVCASKGWTPNSGYVQYRFGPPARAEIVLPPTSAATLPQAAVTIGQGPLSGGSFAFARFSSGKVDYTVYSAITGRSGPKSGVAVDRDGVRVGVRRCDRGKEGEFADGLIDRPGLPVGDTHFDLPL